MGFKWKLVHIGFGGVILLSGVGLLIDVFAQAPQRPQIAFTTFVNGNREIFVIDPDGNNLRNLTNHGSNDSEPAWSPDGRQIAFVSGRDGGGIYIMDADGRNVHRLANQPLGWSPVWSPNGRNIAFVSELNEHFNEDIYVMDADGNNVRRLTEHLSWDRHPAWSPNGLKIAFTSRDRMIGKAIAPAAPAHHDGLEIYVMDADGGNVIRLTNTNGNSHPAWAPDGRRIAFQSRRGDWDIYVMDADGKIPVT